MTNLDKTMATNDNNEDITHENDAEETENDEQEHDENPDEQEDNEKEELRKKLATLEAQKDHWRKKANEKKSESPKKDSDLSSKDLLAVMKAGIEEDDIDDVVEFANFKKISVSEALKNDVVKTILSTKAEYRKTAEIANTGNARKSTSKVSDDVLMENLRLGQVPESKEEARRLFWARNGGKK